MKFRSRSFVEKKKERRKTFFWFFILAISVLIGSFFWFIYADIFQVKELAVKGNSYVGEAKILEIIDRSTNQKFFGIIPKTNILFYPKTEIINQIKLIPEIKDVKYGRLENSVRFDIEERRSAYIYCEGEYPLDDVCYFTDDTGLVFLKSPTFNNFPYLRFYIGRDAEDGLVIGRNILEKDVIDLAQNISDYFGTKEIYPDAVTSSRESLFFTIHIGNTKVYISKKDSIEPFILKIGAITKDKDMALFLQNLEYMDLRLDTKVFLKER